MSTEENVKKVPSALERLKKKHVGQYLDNTCNVCATAHGWNREIAIAAIEAAKKRGLLRETVVSKEVSYRITNTLMVIIHDSTVSLHTQMDFHETTKDDEPHALQIQFLKFKRYTFDELAKTRSEKSTDEDSYPKAFLRSFEHRIILLEHQLENEQRVIGQLVAGPKQIHPVVNKAPMGINDNSENEKIEMKLPQKVRRKEEFRAKGDGSKTRWEKSHGNNNRKDVD